MTNHHEDHVLESLRQQGSKKTRSLLGDWEKRASQSGGTPDIARLALSPRCVSKNLVVRPMPSKDVPPPLPASTTSNVDRKSTRQTMEDLSVFASPRVIRKKFTIPKKIPSLPPVDDTPDVQHTVQPTAPTTPLPAPTSTTTTTSSDPPAVTETNPIASIRDRIKAFERNGGSDNGGAAPWMAPNVRGRRGPSHNVQVAPPPEESVVPSLPPFEPPIKTEASIEEMEPSEKESAVEAPPEPTTAIEESASQEGSVSTTTKEDDIQKDRVAVVTKEMEEMIRRAEDEEIEDDMDETVKDCLLQAAKQSPAYSKRWYDAVNDSWIHCPSLATIVMDFSLIELAEELYEDELPMLYTVSLRAVAASLMEQETELPEYVYRLAF
eukprot:Nitzschia sp. Nitz4//scaffold39_size137210//133727//134866//NITZ4_003222-RA/size137210-processed-gene-0.130-mRNA-1//-1//CDS//3329550452//626//frame0